MAIPTAVEEAYRRAETSVTAVGRYVSVALSSWCEDNDYIFLKRVKRLGSTAEKLETGRIASWREISDLFGCSVVVPTASHEAKVREFLDMAFVASEIRDRNSTPKPPDIFRFDSTRYIAKVRPEGAMELPPDAGDLLFEVQIRTVFEHAWAVVTHDLVYKADDSDWRRARLAAHLKAAVEQIELIIAGFESNMEFVATSNHPETDAKQVIVDSFRQLHSDGFITNELVPESWRRFADNVFALVGSYSNRYQSPARAQELCVTADAHLRATGSASELHSGSLFQVLVGLVNAGIIPNASLGNFTLVESSALRDLHGVAAVPRPFVFD
jgi:ppGpp synthetase/RelA/SpoT-type nucleotidyltranferase